MSTRLPAALRRRQLLDVAMRVFAERGFHDASMNDIAIEAGVTKPVLYQHFTSKRELFAELLNEVGRDLQETITKAVASADGPREMVQLGFSAYFSYVDRHRDAFQLFYGGSMARDEEFAEVVNQTETAVAGLGHGIVGMIEGASIHWLKSASDADPDALAHQLADLAWRGLRGVQP